MLGHEAAMMYPLKLRGRELAEDDEGRRARYLRYLDFYQGQQWQGTYPEKSGQRRLTVNYARAFIRKGAAFLLGTGVRYETKHKGAQTVIDAVLRDNQLDLVDYETAIDSALLGDGCWKATKSGDRIIVRSVDVFSLTATWAGDDYRKLLSVTESYELTAEEIYERWQIEILADRAEVVEYWTAAELVIKVANDDRLAISVPNPYGVIPYVIFPNERRPRMFWGDSDLVDIMELCSEFNIRMSVMSQILQFSGNPVLVLEGVEGTDGRMRVGPGAVWELPENSRAYLLEMMGAGGLTAHMEYISTLHQALFDLAEMPPSAFARAGGANPSGVALELLLQPVVQKVRRKREIWSEALEKRARLILQLKGFPPDMPVRVVWPEILPRDRAALVANEIALVGQGIHSRATANRNLGEENPEMEVEAALEELRRWNHAGGSRQTLRMSGALVQGLADAAG